MNSKILKWWERGKKFAGIFLVLYPVVQAILRDQYGIPLPDFGDYTQTGQLTGAAVLAQSEKVADTKKIIEKLKGQD